MAQSVPIPSAPIPVRLVVHQQSRKLEIAYEDENIFFLPFEYLRVYSPSAEVRGHSPDEAILQTGKRNVDIDKLEPVGNYGVQPYFSDDHTSGIFDWKYLYWLGANQDKLWLDYLMRLEQAGLANGRDKPMPAAGNTPGCGSGN